MSLKDLIWSFCHVVYIRVIPQSWFIMDCLITELEATVGTYQFRFYGSEQYDRQGEQSLLLLVRYSHLFVYALCTVIFIIVIHGKLLSNNYLLLFENE